jgi:hypothetical protein
VRPLNQADFDQLNAVIADPIKRARLRELVTTAIQHRINIGDEKSLMEGLEFAVNIDMKIDVAIFKRLVTKAVRDGVELDIDKLVEEVINDKAAIAHKDSG